MRIEFIEGKGDQEQERYRGGNLFLMIPVNLRLLSRRSRVVCENR